jgi:hypothetical protein
MKFRIRGHFVNLTETSWIRKNYPLKGGHVWEKRMSGHHNWKGFGRKQSWPNQDIILVFAWKV